MNDAHDNAQVDKEMLRYIQQNHLDKEFKADRCHFCEETVDPDDFETEVGEFWSRTKEDTILAHPDCLPLGIDAVFDGTDPEWCMA
jgi:hypothetical protein